MARYGQSRERDRGPCRPARGIAAGLADRLDNPLVDTLVPRVVRVGEALTSLPGPDGATRLADWVMIPQSADDTGLWATTKGLGRFGLPELQTIGVPPQLGQQWVSALSGLAWKVARWWADATSGDDAFVELPATFAFGLGDIARAYGTTPPDERAQVEVRFSFDPPQPGEDGFLNVLPPIAYAGSTGEWLTEICGELFGQSEREIRYAENPQKMGEAIATAQQGPSAAHDRFLAGEFSMERKLIVKHRLTVPGGNEYPWAFVTSWKKRKSVQAVSASDAAGDPKVRAGRPIVIAYDSIVDWAVLVDGEGIVEGGWTNAAL